MTEQFLGAPVELVIYDGTLELSDVEPFVRDYSVQTASEVRIISRWGGPAAGGPRIDLTGPEVAVFIVIGYDLLKHATSDAYRLLKRFIAEAYDKIKTRTGARWYTLGAVALTVENRSRTVRLSFCLPEGLDADALRRMIRLVEEHQERLLAEWERDGGRATDDPTNAPRLMWDEKEQRWRPSPAELRAAWKEFSSTRNSAP